MRRRWQEEVMNSSGQNALERSIVIASGVTCHDVQRPNLQFYRLYVISLDTGTNMLTVTGITPRGHHDKGYEVTERGSTY
jgi:hypothetical protein